MMKHHGEGALGGGVVVGQGEELIPGNWWNSCEGCLRGMLIIATAVQVGSFETCKLKDERLVEHREMQEKNLKTNVLNRLKR